MVSMGLAGAFCPSDTAGMYAYDLGAWTRPVSTTSADAQRWFDRGLIWTYGFHHLEAIACFQRALQADPACAMAWWGIAYATGPNYNLNWDRMDAASQAAVLTEARAAMDAALETPGASPAERALIEALRYRYPQPDRSDDMLGWNDDFARAMREVHAAWPDDLDMKSIFVEAMMTRTPWQLWDLDSGLPADGADTEEARAVLEAAFRDHPDAWEHPGLLHLYVHLMEMSPFPETALRQADRLRTLVPDAGHLVHMASHIDIQCGHYAEALRANTDAIAADLVYYRAEGGENFYTGYRQHNYHFAIYAAMFLGQFAPAMNAADGLVATTPRAMLQVRSPPMADYFESYMAMHPHVLIRFGRWEDILAAPEPSDDPVFVTVRATWAYARAVALAALGRVPEAEAARAAFHTARDDVPETRLLHNNRVVDLLKIATAMLDGEIAYRKGNHDEAYTDLRRAIAMEDALPYDEPWGWMQPVRHALGALLLEQGHVEDAAEVYREDLGLSGRLPRSSVHPDNVWSLKGLHDCLTRLGDTREAELLRPRLDIAVARADVDVAVSCFCAGRAR